MPRPRRIGFATYDRAPALTADDRLALAPLAARGIAVVPVPWRDGPPPPGLDAVVLRSCWDYHLAAPAFRAWLAGLEAAGTPVWNPAPLARWNLDKGYMRGLAAQGVRIPPTAWLPQGPAPDLAALLAAHGLDQAVVKPLLSMTAYRTWRTSRATAAADQATFTEAVADGAVLVQAFVPEVQAGGEVSLVYLAGAFSHACRKRPAPGDFRVQADFGGTRERCEPSPALLAEAARVLAAIPGPWLYARVDGVETAAGFVLMELEVIDPELYLAVDPAAPERLAATLAAALDRGV